MEGENRLALSEMHIDFYLSVEGPQNERQKFSLQMNDHKILRYKEFLWPSPDVSLYIGQGRHGDVAKVVEDITRIATELSNTIIFLEENHNGKDVSKRHCWENGRHAYLSDSDGLMHESHMSLRLLLLDMCNNREKYVDYADHIEDFYVARDNVRPYRLAGGYVLVKARATTERFDAEDAIMSMGVDESFLRDYVKEYGFKDLDDFYSNYTIEDTVFLEVKADQGQYLAFSYNEDTGELTCPATVRGSAMLAFADFLSGKLQENGYKEASKYLDCFLEI